MSATTNPVPTSAAASRATQIIDCDVHELVVSPKVLADYLDEPWKSWVGRWRGPDARHPYVHPLGTSTITNLALRGADAPTALPGADLELMQEELLDKHDISYAILAGQFHPGALKVHPEFAVALASAYNDWLIENWLERDPRLRGSVCIPSNQPIAAAREIDRIGPHPQMAQIMLPVIDHGYGTPEFHPMFEAAQRHGLVVAVHHTGETTVPTGYPPRYIEWHSGVSLAIMAQVYSLLYGGVFDTFESLHVLVLEAGFSWLPHLLLHADQQYKSLGVEVPWVRRTPSETLKERLRVGTQPVEQMSAREFNALIDLMGTDEMLVFSTDYPHWDADEPLRALPGGISRDVRDNILWRNASKLYKLDMPADGASTAA